MGGRRLARLVRGLPDLRGRAAIAQRLYEPRDETWKVRSNGFRFELPASSRMAWRVAFTGNYDHAEIAYLSRFIRPETIVIDAGAALGLWTVPLGARAEVHAFEPMPANVKWVKRNIALNRLGEKVTVHETALGSEAGTAMLSSPEPEGGNAVIRDSGIPVPVARLDDISFEKPVSLIKVDVEGFEPEVLRGAFGLLERDRPVVFGEFAPAHLAVHGFDLPEFLSEIKELGYCVRSLDAARSWPWMATNTVTLGRGEDDLLFLPPPGRPGAKRSKPS